MASNNAAALAKRAPALTDEIIGGDSFTRFRFLAVSGASSPSNSFFIACAAAARDHRSRSRAVARDSVLLAFRRLRETQRDEPVMKVFDPVVAAGALLVQAEAVS